MTPDIQVPIEQISAPEVGEAGYQQFNPRVETLPAGWNGFNSKALPCDILVEHDVSFQVRDGAKLYGDIYRPTNSTDLVPAILCWSPFGKKFNGIDSLGFMTPWSLGIPQGTLSGLEKFEAPDPADWVPRGYAIINIDSRGAFDSEGTMCIMGSQEAQDGYDVIELLAQMPWCNGKVGMAGNSHLAIIQWFVAALRPPHLAAIAPWEGCGDLFREQFARGGIYGGALFDQLIQKYMLKGRHGVESFRQMYLKYPLANSWWNDKRPNMTKINIPTYITGTWTNTMHGMGAIRGWLDVQSQDKWLRWHPYQEWYDLWGCKESKEELLQFFDFYLKDIPNDWQSTPRVRMAVLKFGEAEPISNVVVPDFPLPMTQYRRAFLSTNGGLDLERSPTTASTISYDSKDVTSFATFSHTFDADETMIGIPKAVLFMSCDDADDLDVFVLLRKISKTGEPMLNLNIPLENIPVSTLAEIPEDKRTEVILYAGPNGMLRASVRAIDSAKSMHPNWPYYPQDKEEKVPEGSIVRLEIGMWASGIEFQAGESIRLQVSGSYQGINNFSRGDDSVNVGRHTLHFGGEYDSHVVLPVIPGTLAS